MRLCVRKACARSGKPGWIVMCVLSASERMVVGGKLVTLLVVMGGLTLGFERVRKDQSGDGVAMVVVESLMFVIWLSRLNEVGDLPVVNRFQAQRLSIRAPGCHQVAFESYLADELA